MRNNIIQHYNIEDLAGMMVESEFGTKAKVIHVTHKRGNMNEKGNLYRIEPKSQIIPTLEKYKGYRMYCRILTEEEWKDDEL